MLFGVRRHPRIGCYQQRKWPWKSTSTHATSGISRRSQRLHTSSTKAHIIFSGIQPTGVPHLGNYLGALQQWARLQNEASPSTQLLYSIVDLHAITINQDADQLRRWKRETLATLLAVGLDPERSTIFYQSAVPEHTELMWILSCTASVGHLSRMTQWKSKLALSDEVSALDSTSAKARLKLGLFSYPVLQAADILLYGATHVPVGEDQAQHLEFARQCADQFNTVHGEILVKPQTVLSSAKRVMSLKEPRLKMSKSHQDLRSRIQINDGAEIIGDKIRLALTDSITGVSYDPEHRPGVSNLLAIMSYFDEEGRTAEELAQACKSLSMRQFKATATKAISESLASTRDKYNRIMNHDETHYLDDIATEGSNKARRQADKTMAAVRQVIGLERAGRA
ncbi:MAG: Tryptophan--tRNA ligase, mitochondrial [Alectoria fallacina]|uniref:Tryptophan--tRNA ligase, mitochondrial n=1 Tax=Alectoria fallacina TaxID=1903189 RepID=A0A8H3FXQ6_9LECA|nr:MAG: Tryptophan--tRNA ligase, mitochondrial [Alectoria fallacina]